MADIYKQLVNLAINKKNALLTLNQ